MGIEIDDLPDAPAGGAIVKHEHFDRAYDRDLSPHYFMPSPDLTITVMDISPDLGKRFLEFNTANRPVSEFAGVDRFARILANGDYVFNGDTIRFSSVGVLIDGQHRLLGGIKAGVTFKAIVVEGLPPEAFATIDNGRRRSAGDALACMGAQHYAMVAAALRLIAFHDSGLTSFSLIKMEHSDCVEMFRMFPEIAESAKVAKRYQSKMIKGSLLTALHYLASVAHQEEADYFVEHLSTGTGLDADSPIFCLRRLFEKNRDSTAKLESEHLFAYAIKAFNAHAAGQKMKCLKLLDSEWFPRIAQ